MKVVNPTLTKRTAELPGAAVEGGVEVVDGVDGAVALGLHSTVVEEQAAGAAPVLLSCRLMLKLL